MKHTNHNYTNAAHMWCALMLVLTIIGMGMAVLKLLITLI